jgi:hypothetical protein
VRPSPSLTVVVIPLSGSTLLSDTLRALEMQQPPAREVIVVLGEGMETRAAAVRGASAVRSVRERGDVPRRRARGVREASGDVVALLEDSCVPAPGWTAAMTDAHASGLAGASAPTGPVGGPVIPAPGLSPVSLAAFLVEFGAFLPGGDCARRGDARRRLLPGCNVSYPRRLLHECERHWAGGFHEAFLHDALRRGGAPLRFAKGARVVFGQRARYARTLAVRFRHGRSYAARRVRGDPARALALAVAAPALTPLLGARLARALVAAGPAGRRAAHGFPLAIPLVAAWSIGEAVGYASRSEGAPEHWI